MRGRRSGSKVTDTLAVVLWVWTVNVLRDGFTAPGFRWPRSWEVTASTVTAACLPQIRFQPNDHKTIKETADELKIFEGIKHPNLVRYFGVELHRVSHLQSHCRVRVSEGAGGVLFYITGLLISEHSNFA